MPTPIPASSYPLLMDLINQTYLDRVERIDGAQVADNDDIICAATDGRKALAVRVTGDGIDIRLRGAQTGSPQFAAAPSKKKNCKTGISCGSSCISASKTCSKKIAPKQKAQKQKIVTDTKKESNADERKPAEEESPQVEYPRLLKREFKFSDYQLDIKTLDIAGHKIEVRKGYINPDSLKRLGVHSLWFDVDGSHDASSDIGSKEKLKIAFGVRDHLKAVYEKLGDGTIVHNSPHKADGKGDGRAKLYRSFGFGATDEDGDQWGIMKGGKVIPISREDLQKLAKQQR